MKTKKKAPEVACEHVFAQLKSLLASPVANVVLSMRGCSDLLVNDAHVQEFGDSRFSVPRTLDEATELACRKVEGPTLCYCEKAGSLFALRGEFCLLDQAFVKLEDGEPQWRGLGFLKVRTVSAGVRVYTLYSIHSRLFKDGQSSPENKRMISWLVPLGGLELVVRETKVRNGAPPIELDCTVNWQGKPWLATQRRSLKHDDGYIGFDELLQRAMKQLKAGTAIRAVQREALGILAELKNHIDYGPIEDYLLCLFTQYGGKKRRLVSAIETIRQRLFDPLAVIPEIQEQASQQLREVFHDACTQLSSNVEWPLVRGSLSPEELEVADLYNHGRGERFMRKSGHSQGMWRSRLDSYHTQKALRFSNLDQFQRANMAICKDDALFGMPVDVAPGFTMVIPSEALPLLEQKAHESGFRFKVWDVAFGKHGKKGRQQ